MDINSSELTRFIERAITAGLPAFRQYCSRALKNQLYFQGVQFIHNIPSTTPGLEEAITPEEWIQSNFYQAILTMKHALMSELNPVPVLRSAGSSSSSLLTIRKAIDVILREVKFDEIMNAELWNLILFGLSARFLYEERAETLPVHCLNCDIPIDHSCPICGESFPAPVDAHIRTEVIFPTDLFVHPVGASSESEISMLIWISLCDRQNALRRLSLFGIDQEEAAQLLDFELKLSTSPPPPECWALPKLSELIRIVRRVRRGMQSIGTPPDTKPPTQGAKEEELLAPVAHVFIRKNSIPGLSQDIVLHFIGERYVIATSHSLDDHISIFRHRLIPGRFYPDSEESVRDQQDAINNLLTISYISAMTRSFSVISVDARRVDPNRIARFPNTVVVEVDSPVPEYAVRNAIDVVPGTPITPDVPALRDTLISNMQILGQTFPVLFGQLPPGVEAYKAIEVLRVQSLRAMRPFWSSWYASHFRWLQMALRLAKKAWRKPRQADVDGIVFVVDPNLIETDDVFFQPAAITPVGEQDRRSLIIQGAASGLLDLSDPMNRLRLLSELGLEEFDAPFASEVDVQRDEINRMIQCGEFVPVQPFDAHAVHYLVCRNFLRSSYGRFLQERKPHIHMLIESHGKIHMFLNSGQYEEAAAEMTKLGFLLFAKEKAPTLDTRELAAQLEREVERYKQMEAQSAQGANFDQLLELFRRLQSIPQPQPPAAPTPPPQPAKRKRK